MIINWICDNVDVLYFQSRLLSSQECVNSDIHELRFGRGGWDGHKVTIFTAFAGWGSGVGGLNIPEITL